MKINRSEILTIFLVILLFLIIPLLILAADSSCPSGKICIPNPLKAETFEELLNNILNFIAILALALAPLLIVVAGFYFLTAAGEPARIDTAKKIILYTLIGLVIVLLSKGLIALLMKAMGG